MRPEKITIQKEEPGRENNCCQGTIESVVYIGIDTNYVVRVEWLDPLSTEALTIWDRVWIELKAE